MHDYKFFSTSKFNFNIFQTYPIFYSSKDSEHRVNFRKKKIIEKQKEKWIHFWCERKKKIREKEKCTGVN